jgi:hypothetical protein
MQHRHGAGEAKPGKSKRLNRNADMGLPRYSKTELQNKSGSYGKCVLVCAGHEQSRPTLLHDAVMEICVSTSKQYGTKPRTGNLPNSRILNGDGMD